MKVSLAPALEKFVKGKVREGWYLSPEEVVADALRRWKEADENGSYEPESLEQAILEGISSGDPVPANKAFWAGLRRDVRKRLRVNKPKQGR